MRVDKGPFTGTFKFFLIFEKLIIYTVSVRIGSWLPFSNFWQLSSSFGDNAGFFFASRLFFLFFTHVIHSG